MPERDFKALSLTAPTIHLNGDRAETLREDYVNAYHAVQAARDALSCTRPDGRNFYPQGPQALTDAIAEHDRRQQRLADVAEELMALATYCDSFSKE
jgi:hypothetical protein